MKQLIEKLNERQGTWAAKAVQTKRTPEHNATEQRDGQKCRQTYPARLWQSEILEIAKRFYFLVIWTDSQE